MSDRRLSFPPFIEELSERFIEPLKMIKTLQDLQVLDQNPNFLNLTMPSILVLSEESAGNGVIDTLFGVSVPSGFQIPIILKFKTNYALTCQKIWFQYHVGEAYSVNEEISETNLSGKMSYHMKMLDIHVAAGRLVEIILTVAQPQPIGFTVVILPEINAHTTGSVEMPVLEGYIRKYTTDTRCIILNVLGCSIHDVTKSLSRKILRKANLYGLTVFTKLESSSETLVTQLTSTRLGIGAPFGFFYVEHDLITVRDEKSFKKISAFLANIDKRFIGYQAISENLVLGILSLLFGPSSQIFTKLKSDLSSSEIELRRCENRFESASDTMAAIASFVASASSSLNKLILKDYTEYRKEPDMHVATQLESRFQMLSINLQNLKVNSRDPFLLREIDLLQLGNWPNPSDFNYSHYFKPLLEDQISFASSTIENFVTDLMQYLETVVERLLLDQAIDHVTLHRSLKRIARELILDVKVVFETIIQDHLDVEKNLVYTSNMKASTQAQEMNKHHLNLQQGQHFVNVDGINIDVGHLSTYTSNQIDTAFGFRKFLKTYFDFIAQRLVDGLALHLHHLITDKWVLTERKVMKKFLVYPEHANPNEEPTLVVRRRNLVNRVALLKKIKNEIRRLQIEFEFLSM